MLSKEKPIGIAVYLEKKRTRKFVGELRYDEQKNFIFAYDLKYLYSKSIIPVGPELPLGRKPYISKTLFESFLDRIPSRENPAYPDYCKAAGINVDEEDPFVLLSSIAKRGPSSFVFEAIYPDGIDPSQLIAFRKQLDLTIREFAACFSFSTPGLNRIEMGRSTGRDTLKRLEIYIKFPEVALFEFRRNCGKIHLKKRRHAEKILIHLAADDSRK